MRQLNLHHTVGLALLVSLIQLSSACADTLADCLGTNNPPNSPVQVAMSVQNADLTNGISLRAEILNVSTSSYTLTVCPNMLLCGVKGLHPILFYDETGMGLLDMCKVEKPCPREVFLLPNASYAFDMTIPRDRLPEAALVKGKTIQLALCFELPDSAVYHSNRAEIIFDKQ